MTTNLYLVQLRQGNESEDWVETHVVATPGDESVARDDVLAKVRRQGLRVKGTAVVRCLAIGGVAVSASDGVGHPAPGSSLVSNLTWNERAWGEEQVQSGFDGRSYHLSKELYQRALSRAREDGARSEQERLGDVLRGIEGEAMEVIEYQHGNPYKALEAIVARVRAVVDA